MDVQKFAQILDDLKENIKDLRKHNDRLDKTISRTQWVKQLLSSMKEVRFFLH